jgi:hypothetical protein
MLHNCAASARSCGHQHSPTRAIAAQPAADAIYFAVEIEPCRQGQTRAANHGATVAQLEAIFGWQGGTMASLYTRSADRQRLAIEAMHKLVNDDGTSIPAPCRPVRAAGAKAK